LFETATLRYQNVVRGARASGVTEMEAKTSETASKKRRRGRSYYRKKLNHDMIFESALKKLRTGLEHTEQVQKYTPNPLSNPNSRASRTGMALFPWDTMPTAADVVGGGLPPDRAPRKRQQLLNLMTFVVPFMFDGCTVVDFASGCGHQSIPLALKFPRCKFILIDMKKKSIEIAARRAKELNLKNVTFITGRIEKETKALQRFDIGIALHACGVVSDLMQEICLQQNAVYISCPCCVGKVVNWRENEMKYPRSPTFRKILTNTEYEQLAKAADFGHNGYDQAGKRGAKKKEEELEHRGATKRAENRRLAKTYIEHDRNLYASTRVPRYKTWLMVLHPATCTPKNDLLIGCIKAKDIRKFEIFLSPGGEGGEESKNDSVETPSLGRTLSSEDVVDLAERVVSCPTLSEALPFGMFSVSDSVCVHTRASSACDEEEQLLFADEIWAGSVVMSEYLKRRPDICAGKHVLELGAGAALPSLVSLALGCERAVITDFPNERVVSNITAVVKENGHELENRAFVRTHKWGESITGLKELSPAKKGFDTILCAELLWRGTYKQHKALLTSISSALSDKEDSTVLVSFCHHTTSDHPPEKDIEFFALADTQFGFTVEKIEDKDDLSAFDAESGGYDSEKVHMYSMKRSKR
jgi:predicted nicotinamide N-methyase/tRNA G46 methylase TrmB